MRACALPRATFSDWKKKKKKELEDTWRLVFDKSQSFASNFKSKASSNSLPPLLLMQLLPLPLCRVKKASAIDCAGYLVFAEQTSKRPKEDCVSCLLARPLERIVARRLCVPANTPDSICSVNLPHLEWIQTTRTQSGCLGVNEQLIWPAHLVSGWPSSSRLSSCVGPSYFTVLWLTKVHCHLSASTTAAASADNDCD